MRLEVENIVIFCCGAYHEPDFVYFLESDDLYKSKKLEILNECPGKNEKCKAFIVELSKIDIKTGKMSIFRWKNDKARKIAEKILKNNHHRCFKFESGSKSNMNWIYGENKEIKNKFGQVTKIVQKAVDFNNKKKISNVFIFLLRIMLRNRFCVLLCSFFYLKKCEV